MALCGMVGGKDGKGVPLPLPLPLRGLCGLRTQAQAKHAFPVSWMRSAVARFPRGGEGCVFAREEVRTPRHMLSRLGKCLAHL